MTLPPNVRLIVYSYLSSKQLILDITRLNKKENEKYLLASVIAGQRKFEINLNASKLSHQFKALETTMVFDEELVGKYNVTFN